MKLMPFAWLASLFSGKPKEPEQKYLPESQVMVVGENSVGIQARGDLVVNGVSLQASSEPEKSKEPELTYLQKLLKEYDASKDILVLCRTDYEQYLEDLENGDVKKVDVTKIITFKDLANSSIVRVGWGGGQFFA